MISRADGFRWTMNNQDRLISLAEIAGPEEVLVTVPEELVGSLADRMSQADVGRVPVIQPEDHRLIGIVARKDLLRIRASLLAHEHERTAPLRARRPIR
jgi:CBS domain-containing protein